MFRSAQLRTVPVASGVPHKVKSRRFQAVFPVDWLAAVMPLQAFSD